MAKTKNNLASAYLREGKYKLAAQLYQEVLSNEQGENPLNPVNTSSFSLRDGATVTTTLKNLGNYSSPSSPLRRMKVDLLCLCSGALCRRQGLYEQADFIESCATKSSEDPEAINRALTIIRQIRIYDDMNEGTTRRAQQQPPPQEYGRLRRSGSFQKLRQSIRRGSEKLVQKLRGTSTTGWNNQPIDPSQYPEQQQPDFNQAPMKRASSMSTLNNVPLQQQPINRPLTASHSKEKQQQPPQTLSSRHRLSSTENLHG